LVRSFLDTAFIVCSIGQLRDNEFLSTLILQLRDCAGACSRFTQAFRSSVPLMLSQNGVRSGRSSAASLPPFLR
jgi:hypothetical protein